jgi:hypothetical protein
MTAKDFLQNSEFDLLIVDGDLSIGLSDEDHIIDIINSNQGDWKEYILCGVGIDNYLNSSGLDIFLEKEIGVQLERDGFSQINVDFKDNNSFNFSVDAVRS